MTKKRVYEVAKDLGIENKELIAHLGKLGIEVKSHASSLEDSDVERVRRLLRSREPHEVVEERIKSTVIRRRAVHAPVEERTEPPAEEVAAAKDQQAREADEAAGSSRAKL